MVLNASKKRGDSMQTKQPTELKGIRMPKDLIDKIEKSAEKETRTFSAQVIHIVKSYYDMQEKK